MCVKVTDVVAVVESVLVSVDETDVVGVEKEQVEKLPSTYADMA